MQMVDKRLCIAQDTPMQATQTPSLVGSAQLCKALGINRSTLSRWVAAGYAQPVHQNPGLRGAFVFTEAELARLRRAGGRR